MATPRDAIVGYMANRSAPIFTSLAKRSVHIGESVVVLKQRLRDDWGLAIVDAWDSDSQRWRGILELKQTTAGVWHVETGSFGRDHRPPQTPPAANFAGQWNPGVRCWAAGKVVGDVDQVRLVDSLGRYDEDNVDQGVAILMLEGAYEGPCEVHLFDKQGSLLRTQPHDPPHPP